MKGSLIKNKVFVGGSFALLAMAGLLLFALRSEPVAQAEEQPALDFPALKPASEEVLESLPPIVNDRLSFYVFNQELRQKREGKPGNLAVGEFGQVTLGGREASLATIGSTVCAFFPYGVGICDEKNRIADDGAVGFAPRGCESFDLIGIAPEAVETMTFDADGDGNYETSVPAKSNVYSATLDASKVRVRGLDSDGKVAFEDVIPLNEFVKTDGSCQTQ